MVSTVSDPRRAHPRRQASELELFCFRSSASVSPQLRTNIGRKLLDISSGGARLHLSEPVNRGESVTLELRDPRSGDAFRARGEVRWVGAGDDGSLAGVQFREHYSSLEIREYFATGRKTEAADIVLRPPEKRKAERFSIREAEATVFRQGSLAQQGLRRNLVRQVGDLSTSGARVTLVESLEAGALVQFNLHFTSLPDTIDVLAAVRWCRPDPATAGTSYLCGLQFLNLSDDRRKKVEFMRKWFSKPRK
jgi:c-di-GMP-binding flagellar brake protein YcgR